MHLPTRTFAPSRRLRGSGPLELHARGITKRRGYDVGLRPETITTPPAARPRLPGQIAFIIGNEGCERFSFYGMRNILTQFLVSSSLLFTATEAVPQAVRE